MAMQLSEQELLRRQKLKELIELGIDPYPRKPGVEFAPPKTEDAGAHPFAALASLKKPPGSGGS